MEGFTKNPKIACFKEGGQVGYKSRKTPCDAKDMKEDKAVVKKAVGQHEAAKHKGEGKTELKLKTGGRCKKEGGNVRKYKTGSAVSNLDLKKVKPAEMPGRMSGEANIPGMGKVKAAEMPGGGSGTANIPGMGKVKPVEMPTSSKYKTGSKVKKYKTGGEVVGMKKTADDKKDIAGIKKKGSEPKKKAPKTKQAPTKSMGMAKPEIPMEGELPMFQYGGSTSDIDRKMMESERQRKMARTKNAMNAGLTPSQMGQFAGQEMAAEKPGMMGAIKGALNSGVNMGSPMSATDEERALLKGVTAIGRACGGAI
jgi:hypothetical protein